LTELATHGFISAVPANLSVLVVRSLSALLDAVDLDGRKLLEAGGVRDTDAPERLIDGGPIDDALEELARDHRDPGLALTLALSRAPPFALVGKMMWMSATLGDAFDRGIRFWPMISRRIKVTLEPRPGERCALRFQPVSRHGYGRIMIEFTLMSCVIHARTAVGKRFALDGVSFAHDLPAKVKPRYRRAFGAPVAFGARHTELVFTQSQLALPLIGADRFTATTLEAKALELVRGGEPSLAERARAVIATQLDRPVTLMSLARQLGLGERTFRRRLADEGTSLRALADDIRRTRAEQALAAGVPLKTLAAELGFSDLTALSRAYKRWTGRSPRAPSRLERSHGRRRRARLASNVDRR
jgi:AraC-like DNA-binding protein